MPKIKIDPPIVLTLLNYPLFGTEILENKELDFSSRNISLDGVESKVNIEALKPQKRVGVKKILENIAYGCTDSLPTNWDIVLKMQLNEIDFEDCEPDEYRDDLVHSVLTLWLVMRRHIGDLISSGIAQKTEPKDTESKDTESKDTGSKDKVLVPLPSDYPSPIIDPILFRHDRGGLQLTFKPILDPGKGDVIEVPYLTNLILADFAHFMFVYHQPGIFSYCNLNGCEKIIITSNGRKYCCTYHAEKASVEARKKKDSDFVESKKIRDKLRKRYARHPHKHTINREDYIRKYWDPDKRHLYRSPRSPKK